MGASLACETTCVHVAIVEWSNGCNLSNVYPTVTHRAYPVNFFASWSSMWNMRKFCAIWNFPLYSTLGHWSKSFGYVACERLLSTLLHVHRTRLTPLHKSLEYFVLPGLLELQGSRNFHILHVHWQTGTSWKKLKVSQKKWKGGKNKLY